MNKKFIVFILLCTVFSLEAAVLIDGDFSIVTGTSLPPGFQNKLVRNGANDSTDQGWFRGASLASVTLDDSANTLTYGPSASEFSDDLTSILGAIGQMNTDGAATVGDLSFDFTITSVDLDGDETIQFAVEVFAFTGTTETWNNTINLVNPTFDNLWTLVGSAITENITAAGTYTTGTIDMGSGYDVVGIRIVALDAGTAQWGDTVVLSEVQTGGSVLKRGTLFVIK